MNTVELYDALLRLQDDDDVLLSDNEEQFIDRVKDHGGPTALQKMTAMQKAHSIVEAHAE